MKSYRRNGDIRGATPPVSKPTAKRTDMGLVSVIMQLQQSLGNRGVARMVGDRINSKTKYEETNREAIQRKAVFHKKETERGNKLHRELLSMVVAIDGMVDDAYENFMDGNYRGASAAQIDLYKYRKYQYDKGVADMHPSSAAGYVIEGIVNSQLKDVQNVRLQPVDLLDGTRPDVAVILENQIALLDITASKSAGHILNKKGNWTSHRNIPIVLESVYPSIDFKNMKKQSLSKDEINSIEGRIKEENELKELEAKLKMEEEKNEYLQWQNELTDSWERVNKEAKFTFTDRELKQFLNCGLVMKEIDRMKWGVERIDYDEWNEWKEKHKIPMADIRRSVIAARIKINYCHENDGTSLKKYKTGND